MYPEVAAESAKGTSTASNYNQKVCYHYLGTTQSEDVVCAEFPNNPNWIGQATCLVIGRTPTICNCSNFADWFP